MRQFMRQPPGQRYGDRHGQRMPYILPAPLAMSGPYTEMGEQSDFGRMARGSVGVAELVAIIE